MNFQQIINKMRESVEILKGKFCFEVTRDTIAQLGSDTADALQEVPEIMNDTKEQLETSFNESTTNLYEGNNKELQKMADKSKKEILEELGENNTDAEVIAARHSDLTGQHNSIDARIETFEKKVINEYKPKQTLDEVTLARKSSLYGQSSNLNERLEKSEITVNNNFQSPRITRDNGDPIESWNSGDFLTKLQQMSAGKKIVHVSSLVSGLPTTHTYKMEIYKKEIVDTNYGEGYVKAYSYSTKKEYTRFFDKNTISDWNLSVYANALPNWETIYSSSELYGSKVTNDFTLKQSFNVQEQAERIRVYFRNTPVIELAEIERNEYFGSKQFDIITFDHDNKKRYLSFRIRNENISFANVSGEPYYLLKIEVLKK